MTLSPPISDILVMVTGAAVSTIVIFLLEYVNILEKIGGIVSKIYQSPIFIIFSLSIIAFLSYVSNIMGLVEQYLTEIYYFIFSITLMTYFVAFVAYSVYEGPLETYDPQPPVGWIGSVRIGSTGELLGEFIQVMSFFQASKLLVAGIAFGQWNLSLSFTNALLMNVIATGLAAGAATSVAVRWLKLSEDWDAVIKSLKGEVVPDKEKVGTDSEA